MPFGVIKGGLVAGRRPASAAERVAASTARHSLVTWKECADKRRRKRLEKTPKKWLSWYMPEAFPRAFDTPHLEIIDGCVYAHKTGGRVAVGAERGIGKSTIFDGLALYFKLAGKRLFPVVLPWDAPMMAEAFEIWKAALCDNDRLAADYPEYCLPFAHAQGISQRLSAQRWHGGPHDGEPCGARLQVGSGRIVMPNCLGGIGGKTINGNPRGLKLPLSDGRILRPDLVLIDEPQDDEVARSTLGLVPKTVRKINGAVAGMGQAGGSLPMLMAGNFIECGDVMDTYAKDPNWRCVRVPTVQRWAELWEDKGRCYELWEDWWDCYRENEEGQKAALKLYKENKAIMIKGMVISAPNVYAQQISKTLPDIYTAVMRRYWQDGHDAFMAERQQQPIDPISEAGPYTLTPTVIMSRTTKRKQFDKPDWVTSVVASTDINPSYALSTVVLGFGQDQTACVLWYGLHKLSIPGNTSAPELARQLFEQLTIHGKALAAMPVHPQFWGIDGGGAQFDAVVRFTEQSAMLTGIPAMAFTGRGAKNYRQYGKTMVKAQRREQCHGCLDRKQGRVIRWVAWNADYWKEMAQRAWLGDIGAPGAVTLYDGKHAELANQICGDKLLGKGEVGGQMLWNFTRVPGRNDFGDAMAQCYAVSAFQGIGTGGSVVRRKKQHKRRLKHVNV